jgi:hypothetical protein
MAKRVRYTLYDRLDVSPYANQEEIQAAFRRAAKLIHPDKGVDDGAAETARREAWMKELNEAADILRDPAARAEYDAEIGLRRPGRLRRALSGFGAGLRRHRPAWQLRTFSREAPDLGFVSRAADTLRDLLWSTRIGQWLCLFAVLGLAHLLGSIAGTTRSVLELGVLVVVALALARGGEPTPLSDILALMLAFDRRLWRLTRRIGGSSVRLVASSFTASPGSFIVPDPDAAAAAVLPPEIVKSPPYPPDSPSGSLPRH